MKKIFNIVIILVLIMMSTPMTSDSFANESESVYQKVDTSNLLAYVKVKGYYRKDGTYVKPHVRSNPNGLKYDNYGWKPSQGSYNKTYGTRGSDWDTPTWITDPDYYEGLNLYQNNQSNYSTPSYLTTPTCPANSYYSYSTSSCKCSYGYIVEGGQCINADNYCQKQHGKNTRYNSLKKQCECKYSYVAHNNVCISEDKACQLEFGPNSEATYNDKCKCKYGYQWDSSYASCEKIRTEDSTKDTTDSLLKLLEEYENKITCSGMANSYLGSDNKCYCKTGFLYNANLNGCISYDRACQVSYGSHSYGNKNYCYCKVGYELNGSGTKCTKKSTINNSFIKNGNKDIPLNAHRNFYNKIRGWSCDKGYRLNSLKTACVKSRR